MDIFQFVSKQTFPIGCLYVIGTPIGNLSDISIRALYLLKQVDGIACENKKRAMQILHTYQIHNKSLLTLHTHNEIKSADDIIKNLSFGERWAYISDAGTPGISDPGSKLCEKIMTAGYRIIPIPGASALTSTISVSGKLMNMSNGQFQFLGFLNTKGTLRKLSLRKIVDSSISTFFYEAPHRLAKTLEELKKILHPNRMIFIGQELTKLHENIFLIQASELSNWIQSKETHLGEFTIGVSPSYTENKNIDSIDKNTKQWIQYLLDILDQDQKKVKYITHKITGIPNKVIYKFLLDQKKEKNDKFIF